MNFWLKCFYFISILILVGAENPKDCTVKDVKIKKLTHSSATISWLPLKRQSSNQVVQYTVVLCDTNKRDQNDSCPDDNNVKQSNKINITSVNDWGRIEVNQTGFALGSNYSIFIISLASNGSQVSSYSFYYILEKENNTTEKSINESLTCIVSQDQTSAKGSTTSASSSLSFSIFMGIVLVCIILGGGVLVCIIGLFVYRWSILWIILGIVLVCIILGGGLFVYRWVSKK